jgi:hypothetical protein
MATATDDAMDHNGIHADGCGTHGTKAVGESGDFLILCECGKSGWTQNRALVAEARLAAAESELATLRLSLGGERDAWQRAAEVAREALAAAEARCAELEAQKNAALQRAWSAEASLSVRVGMRREFEELLWVSDTMDPGAFEAGVRRLRALVAAESRAARYEAALREIVHYGWYAKAARVARVALAEVK